jgi:hypothetical protein
LKSLADQTSVVDWENVTQKFPSGYGKHSFISLVTGCSSWSQPITIVRSKTILNKWENPMSLTNNGKPNGQFRTEKFQNIKKIIWH